MSEESTKGLSDLDSISVCRSEIKVLRQQIAALRQQHAKEINRVQLTLNGLRCKNCAAEATTLTKTGKHSPTSSNSTPSPTRPISSVTYNTIGTIVTTFQNKRGVPRQPSVAANMTGTVVIDTAVFNNPDHALCGLEEFSHMWIIFHFHETLSTKVQAKVSPPRLHGERTGVFATRSPHRPCPIGLSLVKIQRIEGNEIHFLGVDMVSGTPVLDLKPYIPLYDYPAPRPAAGAAAALHVDVSERGSPDGQERVSPPQPTNPAHPAGSTHDGIRVAPWILSNPRHYTVTFSTEANDRLQQVIGERAPGFKSNIAILLAEDPRSEYVRNRYPANLYKCAFEELLITAAYSDAAMECVVVAVNDANDFNDEDYEARGEGCGS